MKILIAYYSRTGTTKNVANLLAKELNCDIEEIDDLGKHSGITGWLKGANESHRMKNCEINTISKNPSEYDLVLIGTPVWAAKLASPMYSYVQQFKNDFKEVGCFATCITSGYEETFKQVEKITNLNNKAEMYITKATKDKLEEKIQKFIKEVKK